MDRTDRPLIERVPGKMSGVPVIRGSRVRPGDFLTSRQKGEDRLADACRLPLGTVCQVRRFTTGTRGGLHRVDGNNPAPSRCRNALHFPPP